MSHCLSWSLCKLSDDDSSELVISSLTVLPSWPGDVVIPMLPSGTLLLTILVLSYEACGFILSSVAVLACLSSFCSLLLTRMMPRLQNSCWHGRCVFIRSVLLSVFSPIFGRGIRSYETPSYNLFLRCRRDRATPQVTAAVPRKRE